jgi:hypothetical protein
VVNTVRFGPGRQTPGKGSVGRALTHSIETQIRTDWAPKEFERLAKEQRSRFFGAARTYYTSMWDTAQKVAANTGIVAQSEKGKRSQRGFVTGTIQIATSLRSSIGGAPTGHIVHLDIPFRWRTLSERYARSKPTSRVFWHKHGDAEAALKQLINVHRVSLNSLSSYQKTKNVPSVYDPKTGTLKTTIVISYPRLTDKLDFLREAFASPAGGIVGPPVDFDFGSGLTGINRYLAAETERPLLEPLAREFGRDYVSLIRLLK